MTRYGFAPDLTSSAPLFVHPQLLKSWLSHCFSLSFLFHNMYHVYFKIIEFHVQFVVCMAYILSLNQCALHWLDNIMPYNMPCAQQIVSFNDNHDVMKYFPQLFKSLYLMKSLLSFLDIVPKALEFPHILTEWHHQ